MVKNVISVAHRGLTDWIIQRVSAIYMAVFSIALIVYLVGHPDISFAEWHSLFACQWMKIATILFFLALMFHAWIGVWTIFTDYVKCSILRAILNLLVILMLAASFIWGIMILWSV